MIGTNYPGKATHTLAANWWRLVAIGILAAAILGSAITLDAKKPIKPPSEPPPDYEGGVMYFRTTGPWSDPPHWICEANADGTNLTELFKCKDESMEYPDVIPSNKVYNGTRLFLCTKRQPVTIAQQWWDDSGQVMHTDVYQDNLATSLILVDEMGNESDNLLADTLLVVGYWTVSSMDWYADDTRIAFWGVGLQQAAGEAPGVMEYDWLSMGIYTLDLSLDSEGNGIASNLDLKEWTNTELSNWWDDLHQYAKEPSTDAFDVLVESDGTETLYLTHWLEHPSLGWWDPALYRADLNTGGLFRLRDEDFRDLQVNPAGTKVMGSEAGNIYQYNIDTGEVDTLSHRRYRYGGAQWSPKGENILFGRSKDNMDFFGENVRATASGQDIQVVYVGSSQSRGGHIAWRE